MKGYAAHLFCGVALSAGGAVATAQGAKAAAQVHIDRARAAAYRPGHSLMMLYENVCDDALLPEGPTEPHPTDGGQTAPPFSRISRSTPHSTRPRKRSTR